MNKYQICEFINGKNETVYKVKVCTMETTRVLSTTWDTKQAAMNRILYYIDRDKEESIKLVSCEDYPPSSENSDD